MAVAWDVLLAARGALASCRQVVERHRNEGTVRRDEDARRERSMVKALFKGTSATRMALPPGETSEVLRARTRPFKEKKQESGHIYIGEG
jgi:hypothetical protein